MKKKEKSYDVDAEYLDMIVYNFNYAIDNNLDSVYMGHNILNEYELKEYWVLEKDWQQTLDLLLESATELEEYEYCVEINKIKNRLI